jgi:hypothetical protein
MKIPPDKSDSAVDFPCRPDRGPLAGAAVAHRRARIASARAEIIESD